MEEPEPILLPPDVYQVMLPVCVALKVVVAPLQSRVDPALTDGADGELPVLSVILPLCALLQLLEATT